MGLIVHLQLLQGKCCSVPPLLSSEERFVVQIGVIGHCRVLKIRKRLRTNLNSISSEEGFVVQIGVVCHCRVVKGGNI